MSDAERKRIGEHLRLARMAQRLGQRAAAKKAGVAFGTLQLIEAGGGRRVKLENLAKVAAALGTTLGASRRQAFVSHRLVDLEHLADHYVGLRALLLAPTSEAHRTAVGELVELLMRADNEAVTRIVLEYARARLEPPAAVSRRSSRRA